MAVFFETLNINIPEVAGIREDPSGCYDRKSHFGIFYGGADYGWDYGK